MKYAWIASHLESYDLNLMCHTLAVKNSSYFSWLNSGQEATQQKRHEQYELVKDTFYQLKENAGTRGIKGYLYHQEQTVMSRRKIGSIMKALKLEVKTQKKFKKTTVAAVNDPK